MTRYQPGYEVHWIQARHAVEDRKNWTAVRVSEVEGRRIVVCGNDDAEPLTVWSTHAKAIRGDGAARSASGGAPATSIEVAYSCRWGLLAIRGTDSPAGANSYATNGGSVSVHNILGSDNVRLISVSREPLY